MRYELSPNVFVKSSNAAIKMAGYMSVSNGDLQLTPTATQWQLKVSITTNGASAPFDIVENLLRSFLAGVYCTEHSPQMYEQTKSGFLVTFVPEKLQSVSGCHRREVEYIEVCLDFAHILMSRESIYPEILKLADYAFMRLVRSMALIAPLVFDAQKCARFIATAPFIRPIALALRLDPNSIALEKLCESGLIHNTSANNSYSDKSTVANSSAAHDTNERKTSFKTKHMTSDIALIDPKLHHVLTTAATPPKSRDSYLSARIWNSVGMYFAEMMFQHRRFIVLTGGGEDLHQPVFFNTLQV